MIRSVCQLFRPSLIPTIATAAILAFAGQAHATLIGSSVSANLISPVDSVNLTDTVTVGGGVEIQAGGATNIGALLFTSASPGGAGVPEFIDFSASGVTIRIAAADNVNPGKTGYSAGGKYVFSGLDFQGPTIIGIASIALSSNISNFSNVAQAAGCSVGICFDPVGSSLTVFLDQITMGPDADGNLPPLGLVTINLATQDVTPPGIPEPATLALLAVGCMGLVVARRRSVNPEQCSSDEPIQ